MDSLFGTFHVELKLLLAQSVNFGIVFLVLYFFAFKPITKIMAERTKKIEKGIKDAENIEKKLTETTIEQEKILNQARKESIEILEQAAKQGEAKKKEIIEKAKTEIGQLINQEKEKIQQEKIIAFEEIKKETAELITAGIEKILKEKMNDELNEKLIKNNLN